MFKDCELTVIHYVPQKITNFVHGGLMIYVRDLVEQQINDWRITKIVILHPSRNIFFRSKPKLKKFHSNNSKVHVLGIINPVPYAGALGLKDPHDFFAFNMRDDWENIGHEILDIKPDYIHFHTFTGLAKPFIDTIIKSNVHCVYTNHDYQPLCPKISLIDLENNICLSSNQGFKCVSCNCNAPSRTEITIADNFNLFRDTLRRIRSFLKIFKKKVKKCNYYNKQYALLFFERNEFLRNSLNSNFFKIFASSSLAATVLKKHGIENNIEYLPITHNTLFEQNIPDCSDLRSNPVIGLFGGGRNEKGVQSFIDCFAKNCPDIPATISVFGPQIDKIHVPAPLRKKVEKIGQIKGPVQYVDIVVMNSLWEETFGFIVAEGRVAGKPVIASSNVGAACDFTCLYKDPGTFISYSCASMISNLRHVIKLLNEKNTFTLPEDLVDVLDWNQHYEKLMHSLLKITDKI